MGAPHRTAAVFNVAVGQDAAGWQRAVADDHVLRMLLALPELEEVDRQ